MSESGSRSDNGFFIPYRFAHSVSPRRYQALESHFSKLHRQFDDILTKIQEFGDEMKELNGPPPRPRWSQEWFAGLDAAAAYTIVRCFQPRRIIEVGSGHSTRFMAAAIAAADVQCDHICIDPQPRTSLAGLNIIWKQKLLGPDDLDEIHRLEVDDILFIDSSHIAMPGTDVDLILIEILSALRAGVLIHFHDIFLPDPYPAEWSWRSYNEQIGVGALLCMGALTPIFASHYVRSRMHVALANHACSTSPIATHVPESSLWLRR